MATQIHRRESLCRIRLILLFACLLAACQGFDQQKFDPAYRAGKALEVEIKSSGGTTAASTTLLRQFQTEVSALQGRTQGKRESDALASLVNAADAYQDFLRFRALDYDAPNGKILVMGTLEAVVAKYQLPCERIGNNMWADSGAALRLLLNAAETNLQQGNRTINGQLR